MLKTFIITTLLTTPMLLANANINDSRDTISMHPSVTKLQKELRNELNKDTVDTAIKNTLETNPILTIDDACNNVMELSMAYTVSYTNLVNGYGEYNEYGELEMPKKFSRHISNVELYLDNVFKHCVETHTIDGNFLNDLYNVATQDKGE